MSSFKLDTKTDLKTQVRSAGVMLVVLGVVVAVLFYPVVGSVMFTVGLLGILVGYGATE